MILFGYIKYMLKNPFVNALLAGGYIVGGVLVMSTIIEGISGVEDTIIIPMTMLSLLVLSVAVMGGLFFFEPIRLLLENIREVVAFPKNGSGVDVMMNSPSTVEPQQLKELGLKSV
jgi:hypothetical protein